MTRKLDKEYVTFDEVHKFSEDFDAHSTEGWLMDVLNGELNLSALRYVIKNPGKYKDIGFVFKEPSNIGWGHYTNEKGGKKDGTS